MGMTSFAVAEMGSDERDHDNWLHDSVNEGVTAGMSQLADRILDQVFGLE